MSNIKRCLSIVALLFSTFAHADLSLKVLPYTGGESQATKDRLDAFTRKYVDEHSLVSKDYPYKSAANYKHLMPLYWSYDAKYAKRKESETLYTLGIDGRDYLAAVVSFNPMLTAEPHCQHDGSGYCDRIASGQMVCHLFLFDPKTLNLESATPLTIERDPRPMPGQKERSWQNYDEKNPNDPRQVEGWPACSKLLAVAQAKEVADSLVFTLGYWDSATPASKYDEPPLFKTSVLVSLGVDANGKVQAKQDDSCLGNPNTYVSIGAARKALQQCKARK